MYRSILYVLSAVLIQQIFAQEFTKFIKNDIPITSLSEQTFTSVPNTNIKSIYVVKLQSCQIGSVDEATFNQMPYLRVVSLPYNQIKILPWRLFQNNQHIKVITFANNQIGMLQDGIFENLMLVENINFAHNQIVRIDSNVFGNLTMLKKLDLSHNHLKIMWPNMFMSNVNLQQLQLGGNKMDRIDDRLFSSLENLVYLDLNRNDIMEIDSRAFQNLKSLIMLDFEHNYIHEIKRGTFDNNIQLMSLNLNENNIETLTNGLFTRLINLEHINLKANKISFVGDDVFPRTGNLSSISLERNQLMFLQARTFENLRGLRNLRVGDNPWFCDCNLRDFHAYYTNNENLVKQTIICYKPENLALRTWANIASQELECELIPVEIEDIHLLPVGNDSTMVKELYPPFVRNALELPAESDYENMTMERITREQQDIKSMKIDLGGFKKEEDTNLPDCFNNKPTYFDERYSKNFIEWRARFLGEFLIMYGSAKHTFYPNNDIYKTGQPMLIPNQNGFTFMDPSLTQQDWKYINDYLQEICSITDMTVNGDMNMNIGDYGAIQDAGKLIDAMSEVVKMKMKNHPQNTFDVKASDSKGPNFQAPDFTTRNKESSHKIPIREVHHHRVKNNFEFTEILQNLPKPNMTDGKNIFYYIINAKAEGQAHLNINTDKEN